ncbi:tyrosine-type recombinase/integrase [Mycobacterium riyadhense]|uniref:tyrosine-type recombinase/integrase n=1 Tax=Mycobacterium riyadhense TaxID=486698 RepID=UPI00194F5022|nr:site-specific integrase [Mycobacterium riyadhense]
MAGTKNHRGWGWIRKRSSGRYQASYIGPDNVRHFAPETFALKIEAEEWLTAERRDIQNAKAGLRSAMAGNVSTELQWMSPAQRSAVAHQKLKSQPTLSEYAKDWIEHRQIKENTRIQYQASFDKYIAPKLGSILVSNLRPATIRTWYSGLDPAHQKTRANAYGLLNTICKTAVTDELLQQNPCNIERATVVENNHEAVIPTPEQLAIIADKIEAKFKALVLISAWCGLRFGEVTELRRKDIRYVNADDTALPGIIVVARGVSHRKGCHLSTPKTHRTRKVGIPPHIAAAIHEHLERFAEPESEGGRLFVPVRGGCHVMDRVVRPAFRDACAAAGISGMRLHDLRHFAGTQVARVGNLVETMNHLGHTTQSASLRYQHMVSGRDAEIALALSGLATGKLGTMGDTGHAATTT